MSTAREIALGSAFAALFAWVIVASTGWEPETATFPLLIGVLGLGLALWAVASDALRLRSAPLKAAATTAEDRARGAFAWIAVFFALVLLIGFRGGLPLAVLACYRVEARVGWVASVAAALVCAAFLHVAVAYLHLPLYRGLVFQP